MTSPNEPGAEDDAGAAGGLAAPSRDGEEVTGESCAAAEKIRANSKNIGKQYWLDLRIQNFPFDCRTERIC